MSHDPFDTHKYAYISNVCVAKFARRQGIASNMLYLATDIATSAGDLAKHCASQLLCLLFFNVFAFRSCNYNCK